MRYFSKLQCFLDRKTMSTAVQEVLAEESANGMIMANRLRYVLVFLLTVVTIIFREDVTAPVNFIAVALLWVVTLTHTFLLKYHHLNKAMKFNYIVITLDCLVIFGLILLQAQSDGREIFVLAAKNSNYWILLLFPFILQLPQLRIKFVALAVFLMIVAQYCLVALALFDDPVLTNSFYEARMSEKFHLTSALLKRPIIVIGLGLVISYSIYRAIFMVRRLGEVQQQKMMLSRYFSPQIIEEIITYPDVLRGGKRQKVTVLFCDIRGFAQLSEQISPDELVAFLSEFRERMSKVIFDMGGTIDKFIGDAIMATFGTPKPSPIPGTDSLNAVKAGLNMLEQLEAFNQDRIRHSLTPIRIGIGIHTGKVIAGSIGQGELLEYTVIGDVVNTASRIESLCKELDANFIISKTVHDEVHGAVQVQPLPATHVKGKEQPLDIYQIISQTI